jgi:spore maturation protein CgeB
MRVLLIGSGDVGNIARFFFDALTSLGHEEYFIESEYIKHRSSLFHKIASRLIGRRPLTYWRTNREVLETVRRNRPHITLITKGQWISPAILKQAKTEETCLVNYATDDPFNLKVSSSHLIKGIPFYDLYVCTKRAIMAEIQRAGCPNVAYVPFAYEPKLHFPEQPSRGEEARRFSSDVVFVGGADLDRLPIMRKLVAGPWQLNLYGGLWNRDQQLRNCYRGFVLGRDYRLALGGAKVCLGLVRRANRDGHSMRSFEIPACGAFMLAERTQEHLEFFEEDKEAAYFGSDEELLSKVRYYLSHEAERRRIACAGYRRVITGRNTYQDRLETILQYVKELPK